MLNFLKNEFSFNPSKTEIQKIIKSRYQPTNGGLGDFCLALNDDGWHIFHIWRLYSKPQDCHCSGQEVEIGHGYGKNIVDLATQSAAISVRENKWDNAHLWAPTVVFNNNLWYMYYTGMTDNLCQKIGLATSKDLWHWNYYLEEPVIDVCKFSWAKADANGYTSCRDPYVTKVDDAWYCYYTAATKDEKSAMGLCISKDLYNWEDIGPCLIKPYLNNESEGTWVTESPCMFEKDGLFYLIYNHGLGLRYVVSDKPNDFHHAKVKELYNWIYNFELLDLESGLFAYAAGYYSGLQLGFAKIYNGEITITEIDVKPGAEIWL